MCADFVMGSVAKLLLFSVQFAKNLSFCLLTCPGIS
jgi:hypothetical protein